MRCAALVVLLALCVGLAAPAAARAQALRVCYAPWPPYAEGEEGAPEGISIEIVREAARRADLDATFHEFPWNRCLLLVESGELDAVLDAAERPEFLQGPASFSLYSNTFWVRADAGPSEFRLAHFDGKTVGLVTGYVYPAELTTDVVYDVDYSVDDASNVRKLAFGRLDGAVADLVSTLEVAREHELAVRPLSPAHSVDRLFVSFNPGRSDLHARVDAAIAEMLLDGAVDRVYRERLGISFADVLSRVESGGDD